MENNKIEINLSEEEEEEEEEKVEIIIEDLCTPIKSNTKIE